MPSPIEWTGAASSRSASGCGLWGSRCGWWTDLPGLALGVVLWSIHGSLESGAWEALVYDELSAAGDGESYAVVMARLGQATVAAVVAGALVASGLLWGGVSLAAVGWVIVVLNLPAIVLVLGLPAAAVADDVEGEDGWWTTLRTGLREALSEPSILKLVVLGALIEGLFVFDDYAPVLGELLGASSTVTSLLVVVWVGLWLGGEVAARRPDLSPRTLALALVFTADLSIAALASGSYWGVAALGCCYGGMQLVWVLYDARFQDRIEGTARATTTSVRSVGRL